jgi:filamentous hemagglutinin family protein
MKSTRKTRKKCSIRRAIAYLLACGLIVGTSLPVVLALDATDVISSTGAVPTQWGDHTVIDTQNGAIINWSNFDTSAGQSVTFNQYLGSIKDSSSAVLNRISSAGVPTAFNGALNANGRVFIVNPAGILFGAGSTVNVTQLVASGLNMSDEAFQAALADPTSSMNFEGGAGQVKNYGSITADSVYLVGKRIANIGTITAPNGLVVLAAGDNVYLAQNGSNVLVTLKDASADQSDAIVNKGSVTVGNGKIVLAAGDAFSSAITDVDNLAETSSEEDASVVVSCTPSPRPKKPSPCPSQPPAEEPPAEEPPAEEPPAEEPPAEEPPAEEPPAEEPPTEEPPASGSVIASAYMVPAPVPEIDVEYSGCPALMKWTAAELGIDARMMEIWTSNALASTRDIQPCTTCAKLRSLAGILRDTDGSSTTALSEVIGQFASRTAPPTPEEMTMIASAIADNSNTDGRYAKARVYLDALSEYVGTLSSDMNFSKEESVLFAADRYVAPLAEDSRNDAVVAFIASRLAALGG